MLNFRLFGHHVQVQWMFWVLCAVIGSSLLSEPGPDALLAFAILVASLFASVLLHELGHAFARQRFGAPHSEIVLHGIGGYCAGPGRFTRGQSVLISAAGPAMNFVLAGIAFALLMTPGAENEHFRRFFFLMFWINALMGGFNLLPIIPLDGGRIFESAMARRNPDLVPRIGFVLAVILGVLGLLRGSLWLAFLFGFMAFENWNIMQHRSAGRGL